MLESVSSGDAAALMSFMLTWYMYIKLAGAVEAVVSSFRVMLYLYIASIIEHCDLVAMQLMVQ